MQLTSNFHLNEVTNWPKFQGMKPTEQALAIQLATDNLTDEVKENARKIAVELQELREIVNHEFKHIGVEIGLRALSWFRPKEWELMRQRSGNSQHITGHAVDFIVTGLTPEQTKVVMQWLFNYLHDWNGGLAVKYGAGGRISFIHIDLGKKRRWVY